MRNPNRGLGAAVVFVSVVFAACISEPRLSASIQLQVTSNVTVYDFQTVPVGSGSSTNPMFVISPAGSADDDYITSISLDPGCPDFALNLQPPLSTGSGSGSGSSVGSAHVFCMGGSAVPAGVGGSGYGGGCTPVQYMFGATFTPHLAAQQFCDVHITTMSGSGAGSGSATITLTGSGQSPMFLMSVSPMSIDFGDVNLNTTSGSRIVTVQNTGSGSISVNGSNSDPTTFSTPSLATFTLAAAQSKSFTVTCNPASPQTYNATLSFATNAAQGSLSGSTSLTCRGANTSLVITPNPIDFGSQLLGAGALTRNVTIQNGSASVTLMNFRFTNAGSDISYPSGPPGPFTIPMGSSANFVVQYTPSTERVTGPLGSVTFDIGSGSNNSNIPITGGAEPGSIGTAPASVDFGPICAGGSASQDVMVFANAAGTVRLAPPTAPGAPFTVSTSSTLPIDLIGNHGSQVIFNAKVQTSTPGKLGGTLTLNTNIPNMPTRQVALAANVLPMGVTPTPDQVRFGAVAIGTSSPPKQVVLTNCSGGPLTVTGTTFAGTNPSEFVAPATPPTTLQPMESAAFLVLMSPHTNGPKSASFVIMHDPGTSVVAVDGTGFAGTDTGTTGDRETYYACATNRPATMWPIALAVLVLRRRRKRVR